MIARTGRRFPGGARWGPVALGVAVTAEAALRRGGAAPPRALRSPLLFVVGCPRSGTTWVQSMLEAHPGVLSTRESHAYVRTQPLRRAGPRSARAWAAVLRPGPHPSVGLRWYAEGRELRQIAVASARGARTGDQAADAFVLRLFDAFLARAGATADQVMVEKTPNHLLHARRLLALFPAARLVEVLRDGRDVCASMEARAPHVGWIPTDRERQIRTWVRYVEQGEQLRADARLEGRLLRIRYEDLKDDPRSGLSALLDFAGLETSPPEVDRIVAATDFARRGGTPDGSSPNRRGVVGDWETRFSPQDMALFRRLAGPAAARAGYAVEA